jgi:putative oxidoreductase
MHALIRIIIGGMLIYHGQELFHQDIVDKYLSWEVFRTSYGKPLVYAGKIAELLSGISLVLGLYTRIGALLCIGTMLFITFVIGHGRIWYEDQHPFLLVLFGIVFLVAGPGAWSVDGKKGIGDQ